MSLSNSRIDGNHIGQWLNQNELSSMQFMCKMSDKFEWNNIFILPNADRLAELNTWGTGFRARAYNFARL